MKVKVCGITSYEDAAMALDQAVDALGFNFFPSSPRYVSPAEARSIICRLPPLITTVGVFVNVSSAGSLMATALRSGVQVLQLHGDETPEYCNELSGCLPLIKALRIGNDGVREDIEAYPVQAFLLDSRDDALFGGTGRSFNWKAAAQIKRVRPIIVAGGLRPDNVGEAIRALDPYAVDVCSGVESKPGKKDPGKLKAFMNEVRNVGRK